MNQQEMIKRYNYADFTEEWFIFARQFFADVPQLGKKAPDFPLWQVTDDKENPLVETTLLTILKQNKLTVVEFGSFT